MFPNFVVFYRYFRVKDTGTHTFFSIIHELKEPFFILAGSYSRKNGSVLVRDSVRL